MSKFFLQKKETIYIDTQNQNLYEITKNVKKLIKDSNIEDGLLNLSILHTSASLLIQENASPEVKIDLKNFFNNLVPMNANLYKHSLEGVDDMPAHIKTALTNTNLTLSVIDGSLLLGDWQGIFLFEHRLSSFRRKIFFHLVGID